MNWLKKWILDYIGIQDIEEWVDGHYQAEAQIEDQRPRLEIYVDPNNGSDANSGESTDDALQSISYALKQGTQWVFDDTPERNGKVTIFIIGADDETTILEYSEGKE